MSKGIYSFLKDDEVFIVVCKKKCPNEWKNLSELDGLEVESDENFYIMGTDARAEIECTSMDKLFVFKSNDKIFFKCPISNEIEHYFLSYGTTGFYLVQSEITIDEEQVFQMFLDEELESLICCFYTEEKKKEIFELDNVGNILSLKQNI